MAAAATPIIAPVMMASGGMVRRDGVVSGIDGLRSARQDPKDLAIGALEAGRPAIGPKRQDEIA